MTVADEKLNVLKLMSGDRQLDLSQSQRGTFGKVGFGRVMKAFGERFLAWNQPRSAE